MSSLQLRLLFVSARLESSSWQGQLHDSKDPMQAEVPRSALPGRATFDPETNPPSVCQPIIRLVARCYLFRPIGVRPVCVAGLLDPSWSRTGHWR